MPATIKSRCQQFAFQRILPGDIAHRLRYVAQQEGIDLQDEGAQLIARLADGGLRDALSLLDQCAVPGGPIGERQVLDALGLAGNLETARLMGHLAARETEPALADVARLYGGGKDVSAILGELSSLARDLLIRKTAPRSGGALLNGGYDEATLRALSEQLTVPRLTWMLGLLQSVLADLPRSSNRRTDAELCVIRLCDETLDDSGPGLTARVSRLEAQLSAGPAVSAPPLRPQPEPERTPEAPEETPPWDLDPPPAPKPEPKSEPNPKPADAPARPPEPPQPAAPPPGPAAPAPKAGGALWEAVRAGLKDKVSRKAYTFLSKPDMVLGRYENGVLTLWAEDDLVKAAVSGQEVLETVAALAAARAGCAVRCAVKVGRPPEEDPAPAPAAGGEHDALDDLLAFGSQLDNFTVKE